MVSSIILFIALERQEEEKKDCFKKKRGGGFQIHFKSPRSGWFLSPSYQSRRCRGPEVSLSRWWSGWRRPCRSQSQWAAEGRRSPPASAWSEGARPSALLGLRVERRCSLRRDADFNTTLWFTTSLNPLTNVALRGVTLSSHNRGVTLHQTHDSVEMMLVDDSAVVRRAFGISAIKLLGWIERSWWDSRLCTLTYMKTISSDRTVPAEFVGCTPRLGPGCTAHTRCSLERCTSDRSWQTFPMWFDCTQSVYFSFFKKLRGSDSGSQRKLKPNLLYLSKFLPKYLITLNLRRNPPNSGVLPAGDSDVTVLVDVAGALPSQLQGHWGEVASCSRHHQFAHCAAACVEDVVKPEPQKLLGLWHSTCHHRVQVLEIIQQRSKTKMLTATVFTSSKKTMI